MSVTKQRESFKILGTYEGKKEELDVVLGRDQAEDLAAEYRMAFGSAWTIRVVKGGN